MASPSPRLFTRTYWLVVLTQAVFAFAWATFLVLPKFLQERFDADPEAIGRVSACSNVAAVLLVPVLGRMIDSFDRRSIMTVGALVCAGQALGHLGLTGIDARIYVLQMVLGVAFIATYNAGGALVSDLAPPERLGQALGMFGSANIVMNAVAPLVVEWLAARHGWNAVFVLASIMATLAAGLSRALPRGSSPRPYGVVPRLRVPDRALVRIMATAGIAGVVYSSVMVFFQPYVLSQGARAVSPFFLGFTPAVLFVRLVFGPAMDRLGRRRVAAVALAGYGTITGLTAFLRPATLPVFGALFGLAHGVLHPALAALSVEGRASHERGTALVYMNGGSMLGNALAAWSLGLVAVAYGYAAVFLSAAAVTVLGLLALRPIRTRAA